MKYSERRTGINRTSARKERPIWEAGDVPTTIAPEHIVPSHERRDITDEVDKIDQRIRGDIAREFAEGFQKAGVKIDMGALQKMLESGGRELPTEYKVARAALSESLTTQDFQKIAADFVAIGNTKDGDVIPADNVFLPLLQAAGGSIEAVSETEMRAMASAQGEKALHANYVKVWGGNTLVGGAYGLNALMFVVDTAIAKSILDYGLLPLSTYAGPEWRNALAWALSIAGNIYLLRGKNNPSTLNPRTRSGALHAAAFGLLGAGAVTALAAQVVSSEDRAKVATKVGVAFTANLGKVETGVQALTKEVAGIGPAIEPLIKAKARAAAAEGKTSPAASVDSPQLAAARKRLTDAEARLKTSQTKARQTAVEQAQAALAKLEAARPPVVAGEAVVPGADVPPNGPKSYTAWRVTYGLNHPINGKALREYVSGLAPEFAGFTVAKTEEAMKTIEAEFGLQPGEGMAQLLAKLEANIKAVSVDKLLTEKESLEALVKKLSPNRLKYILGPLYSLYERDFSGILHGGADVEDLFSKQPQLLAVAKAVARDLEQVKVTQDLQRYQQRVRELTGLDLGIQFPKVDLTLSETQVDTWAIDRKQYADVLDRTTLSYLTELGITKDAPIILGVLGVLLGGLLLTVGATATRRRWREDNLSGYEAQEFAREGAVAKALASDLAARENSLYVRLNGLLTQQPSVRVDGERVRIDLALPPEPQRSTERLEAIVRRGMRIAALKQLQKPEGMDDAEFLEMKKAFVERRPRRGVFLERKHRAHLGSEELAHAYNESLNMWIKKLAGADRLSAMREIRAEVTSFDGTDADRDKELDRFEAQLQSGRVFTAGQARELYMKFDAPFRLAETQDILGRIGELTAQREALMQEGAGKQIELGGQVTLSAQDLLLTHMLGDIDTELDYQVRLYEEIVGRDGALEDVEKQGKELTNEAKKELAERMAAFYANERDDRWGDRKLSDVVSANQAIISKVSERVGRLSEKAKAAFRAQSLPEATVRFLLPYDGEFAERRLEIELINSSGTEIATLTFPHAFPSATLDSDQKILETIDAFLNDDSIELQIARAEASKATVQAEIDALETALPAEINLSDIDTAAAEKIDRLILLKDVLDEQGIALDKGLRAGKTLSDPQKVLFGERPEEARFTRFWKKKFETVAQVIVAQYPNKTLAYSIELNSFLVKEGGELETIVGVKEV